MKDFLEKFHTPTRELKPLTSDFDRKIRELHETRRVLATMMSPGSSRIKKETDDMITQAIAKLSNNQGNAYEMRVDEYKNFLLVTFRDVLKSSNLRRDFVSYLDKQGGSILPFIQLFPEHCKDKIIKADIGMRARKYKGGDKENQSRPLEVRKVRVGARRLAERQREEAQQCITSISKKYTEAKKSIHLR
jgi:uncharacterized protein YeeX (DUF496 family)